MGDTVLQMEHVSKELRGRKVLSDICLEFFSGRVYGIEGTNGSGKTMLMRVAAGLIYPTQGSVAINGKRLTAGGIYPARIGALIENPAFLAGYTGLGNLKLLASLGPKSEEAQLKGCLAEMGLDPEDKRKYKKYSLGMKQRLGIAAAAMGQPDILILDEPVNALDEEGVNLARSLIQKEKRRGALVILSCHDREFLENISDELYIMREGVLSRMAGGGSCG